MKWIDKPGRTSVTVFASNCEAVLLPCRFDLSLPDLFVNESTRITNIKTVCHTRLSKGPPKVSVPLPRALNVTILAAIIYPLKSGGHRFLNPNHTSW